MEEVGEGCMQFIDEFLSEIFRAVVGLAVQARIFNANKVVLDAGFNKRT